MPSALLNCNASPVCCRKKEASYAYDPFTSVSDCFAASANGVEAGLLQELQAYNKLQAQKNLTAGWKIFIGMFR